jgi:uncharacterized membrane protein
VWCSATRLPEDVIVVMTDIEVELPVRAVYNQWTQFEEFPEFMENVEEVRQLDDEHLHWKVSIAGVEREWDARITEQSPDERIAWTATDGTENAGVVTFHPLSQDRTKVVLQLEMDPQGFAETVADKTGLVANRAKNDLENFKQFIEARGMETGGYRGEVRRPDDGRVHPNEHAVESNTMQQSEGVVGNMPGGSNSEQREERVNTGNVGREAPYGAPSAPDSMEGGT